MSIQSYVTELEAINAEIKRNNATNRSLRSRASVLEEQITGYLDSKNQEGLKFKGKRFVLEEKVTHKQRGKKDKEEETLRLLSELGIADNKRAYEKLMEVQKGEEIETRRLKITNNKKTDDYY